MAINKTYPGPQVVSKRCIVREINNGGGDNFIVVADDSNSVYLDSDITACAISITAAS